MRPSTVLRSLFAAAALAGLVAACSDDDNSEPTPTTLTLSKLGGFEGGVPGASEIVAFDAGTKRAFVVNGANANVDVLDLTNPAAPVRVSTIDIRDIGGGVNSVAVHDGLVALAVEASPKTSSGRVAFYSAASLARLTTVTVGAQPDMIVFTSDGTSVLTANEGEPNSYGAADSVDPEGSISIVAVNRGGSGGAITVAPTVRTAGFTAFNAQAASLRAAGVRIYGPNATVAQDLEPEYITISEDNRTAYVTLQENNAIALVDIPSATVTAIHPLGTKDHSVAGAGFDPSDEDGGTNTNSGTPVAKIGTWPVRGMYLPDGLASFSRDGQTYLITANEGDARADWPGFNEEVRIRAHCTAGLDPAAFPGATGTASDPLLNDSNLGRLRVTNTPNGGDSGKNAAGQCNKLWSYGARSFTIWSVGSSGLTRVFDSGDQFEQRTLSLTEARFNASHDNNDLDGRSASKGPEPENVTVAKFGDKVFAFIVLERVGGVMVYDVTTPSASRFVTYFNPRNALTGDRGPEGIAFVPADKSPNGRPLILVGHEVSGSTTVLQVNLVY